MSVSPVLRVSVCLCSCAVASTASAVQLQWKTLFEAVSGPPYPSAQRVQFEVYGGEFLPAVQHSFIHVGLGAALADGAVAQSSLLGGDNGAGGITGPQAGLQARIETPAQTGLNMDLLIEAFGDGSVRQGAVMQDFHFNASSFDLAFDVLPGDGSVHKHAWHGQVAAGQNLEFGGAGAEVLGDGSVRLFFGLIGPPGGHVPDAPVVEMAMLTTLVPEPAAGLLLALGAAVGLHRREPSNFRPC